MGALAVPVARGRAARSSRPGEPVPSEGLVVETLRIAGLLHDVGHGPFAHFFDDRFLAASPPRRTRAGRARRRSRHEDLSPADHRARAGPADRRGLRRAPGSVPERDRFADGEAIDPRWVSFLISKPPLADPSMPGWVRTLQPLLSGVFTVDNLDYVRRDAYLTGVSMGPVDAERLRRYAFVSERGLTLYESGVGALEMFLTARLFMYQHVYLHRTVRAIDLDLAEVFAPSIRAVFGDGSPAERLAAFADLDEYALLHQAALLDARRAPLRLAGAGRRDVTPEVADGWRAILLRRPRWRTEREVHGRAADPRLAAGAARRAGRARARARGRWTSRAWTRGPERASRPRSRSSGGTAGRARRWTTRSRGCPAWSLVGRRYRRIGLRGRRRPALRAGEPATPAASGRGRTRSRLAAARDSSPRPTFPSAAAPAAGRSRAISASAASCRLTTSGSDPERRRLERREQAVVEVAARRAAGHPLVADELAGLDVLARA